MHAAVADRAGRGAPVDRDQVAAGPTGREAALMSGERENAAALDGGERAGDELVGDGEAPARCWRGGRADSDSHRAGHPVATVDAQQARREVDFEAHAGAAERERAARGANPAAAAVVEQHAVAPAGEEARDEEGLRRAELRARDDALEFPAASNDHSAAR